MGLALGILWGIVCLIMGLLAIVTYRARPFVEFLGIMYIGYKPSILGSIIGFVWGSVDAFIFGFLIAWLYNKLSG